MEIKKLIFICTGNICRSPMAVGLARREVRQRGLELELESAGTGALDNSPPSVNAYGACMEIGIDISEHRAQQVHEGMDGSGVMFAAMTPSQVSWLRRVLGIPAERVALIGSGIPDPFGGDINVYRRTRDILEMEIRELFDRLEPFISRKAPEDGSSLITTVTAMTMDDVREVAAIEEQCFSDPWNPNAIAEEVDNPNAAMLVSLYNGNVCGYGCVMISCDTAYIPKLCVCPAYRRMGIGSSIMEALENIALEDACTELTLEVRESNSAAIELYHKLGFVTVGKRPGFYRSPSEAALIMTKRLAPAAEPAVWQEEAAPQEPSENDASE